VDDAIIEVKQFFAENKVTEPQQMDHVIRLNEINLVEQLKNCFKRIEINELLGLRVLMISFAISGKKFHEMRSICK
jgi:hypothetical protein